jgi:tetratricopeptide (TPR) repeat protein
VVEEDSCLIILSQCWLNLNNPKAPVNCYEQMIKGLNELSDKFGYTVKTYNILGIILMIQGETEKAAMIYENALNEYNVYTMQEGDPLLSTGNYDLQSLIYNYIKCNAMV